MPTLRASLAGETIGLFAAAAESLRPSLTPRSTLHQGLVTGLMGLTGAAVGAAAGSLAGRAVGRASEQFWAPALAVAVAGGIGVRQGRSLAVQQRQSHAEWGPQEGNAVLGALAGGAGAAGLATGVAVLTREIGLGGRAVADRVGGSPRVWSAAATIGVLGAKAAVAHVVFHRVLDGLAEEGRAPDAALEEPIDDPFVTGGPGSEVPYDTLSREGRRFVHWRWHAERMRAAGTTHPQEPVRVFVGVDSAPSITTRVDLAMRELERLGAFRKRVLFIGSPAGSGYANSVPLEALEFLTDGDCAGVVVQYGVLPSMFSRRKLPLAAETFRTLVDRIDERIREEAVRPRLFVYGESLGAQAAQVGLGLAPSLVDEHAATLRKVDAALFVGTPGGPSLRDDLLGHPATVHVDQWQRLPDPLPSDVQLWFLEHDADPVTRFSPRLMFRRPPWLAARGDRSGPRGRNIPEAMRWLPVATWQQVLLDVAYATQAQSGVFRSVGHDYRADLAPLVAAAFAPEARDRVDRVQELLAERESTRDRMLAAAEGGDLLAPPPTAASEPTP